MARLQENGIIIYSKRELQATPPYWMRDAGLGGRVHLNPNDPAARLGFLPGQTLARRLFPDPRPTKQDEMVQIAELLMGSDQPAI